MRIAWRTRAALACLLVAVAAPESRAQDARLNRRLDAPTAAAVAALVDSARGLALPTEALVQKALEGRSKGASGAAIVGAVRSLIRDLAVARDALGPDVNADALRLGAAVLDAGVSSVQLERLRPHRSGDGFIGALAGTVYLLSRGVPAEASLDLISGMLDARLTDADFSLLQRLVERDLRAGASPVEAATVRARALIRHGPPRDPRGGLDP